MDKNAHPPCSDEALKTKTGRDWSEWCQLLDARGAMELDHTSLAKLVDSLHRAGGWWSQTVAVGYERLRGKRLLHERSDSTFTMSTSKTLQVDDSRVHSYFVDGRKRGLWLKEEISIRTATAPKSVRMTWPDNTSVAVWISAKGENKCSVAVEHSKLKSPSAVKSQKQFWREALQRLEKVAL